MDKKSKIMVAGAKGMVGSSIVRNLVKNGYQNVVSIYREICDLTNQDAVYKLFSEIKPEYVILAAAKVGGINANNSYPADFIRVNLQIQTNVIEASHKTGVKKLMFLGSSCIYPRDCPQPIKESYLLTGVLEKTNEAYALAKISGLKMCEFYNKQYGTDYISCMPTNLYGINDNYDLENSHVLPALIAKIHKAKTTNQPTFTVWGTGKVLREFLYVDDLADACIFLMNHYSGNETVNIGTGIEVSIQFLAETIAKILNYNGKIEYDSSMPDGTPRKLLDVSKLSALGWKYKIDLEEGIRLTYQDYLLRFEK